MAIKLQCGAFALTLDPTQKQGGTELMTGHVSIGSGSTAPAFLTAAAAAAGTTTGTTTGATAGAAAVMPMSVKIVPSERYHEFQQGECRVLHALRSRPHPALPKVLHAFQSQDDESSSDDADDSNNTTSQHQHMVVPTLAGSAIAPPRRLASSHQLSSPSHHGASHLSSSHLSASNLASAAAVTVTAAGGDSAASSTAPSSSSSSSSSSAHTMMMMMGARKRKQTCCLVFQHYYGDLYSLIRMRGPLPEGIARRFFVQIATALQHCHAMQIVVRDVKLGHLLFADARRTQLVLADLSNAIVCREKHMLLEYDKLRSPAYVAPEILRLTLSRRNSSYTPAPSPGPAAMAAGGNTAAAASHTPKGGLGGSISAPASTSDLPAMVTAIATAWGLNTAAAVGSSSYGQNVPSSSSSSSSSSEGGVSAYASSSSLASSASLSSLSERYDGVAADIWALGIVLYTMLVGTYPFHDEDPARHRHKLLYDDLALPATISPDAAALLRAMLSKDPNTRLAMQDVLTSKWVRPQPLSLQPQPLVMKQPYQDEQLQHQHQAAKRFKETTVDQAEADHEVPKSDGTH